ncbi:MAG TPA: 2'-5' RNA ligase family protein [Sphingobacteriaceae bacterium]
MKALYLIAILPPPEQAGRIDALRRECSKKYQVFKALRPPVHMTLYKPVWLVPEQEEQLIRQMRLIGAEQQSFMQEAENFSRFSNRVLYLQALPNPALSALQRRIARVFIEEGFDPDTIITEAYHPHFTMAYRDVTPGKFQEMWNEYKGKSFRITFPADNFSILKHDGKKWLVLEDIALRPV